MASALLRRPSPNPTVPFFRNRVEKKENRKNWVSVYGDCKWLRLW